MQDDLTDQHVRDNYRALRAANGWTWEELAVHLEQQAPAPAVTRGLLPQDGPYRALAAWARQQAAEPPQQPPTPQPATPGPRKRTATPAGPPRRTAS